MQGLSSAAGVVLLVVDVSAHPLAMHFWQGENPSELILFPGEMEAGLILAKDPWEFI